VLLAGDMFEHHDVDEPVVRKTDAVLDSFAPIPVFVLPGNHDPLIAGGVWDRQSWRRVEVHGMYLWFKPVLAGRRRVAVEPANVPTASSCRAR